MSQQEMFAPTRTGTLTYPRRCAHVEPGTLIRCDARATHRLTEHGEIMCYAGLSCEKHARVVVDEFAEKLPAMGYGMVEIEEAP